MIKLGDLVMILDLARQGLSVSAIARRTGFDRKTVRRHIERGLEPPAYTPRPPRLSLLSPYEPFLRERLATVPELTARRLHREIKEHGVEVRPVCVNASRWDCTLEETGDESRLAVRLGMRMVKGLANAHAASIVLARADRNYVSVDDLWRRAGVPQAELVRLAEADAFRPGLGLARREALWAIKGLRDEPLPLFAAAASRERQAVPEMAEQAVELRPMTAGREVLEDYARTGLSLKGHPVGFLRTDLRRRGMVSCREAMEAADGKWVEIDGLVLVRQQPGTASGVLFVAIEDETGAANLIVRKDRFEKYRREILGGQLMAAKGRVHREGEVVHLIVHMVRDISAELAKVPEADGQVGGELRVASRNFR